MYQAILLVCITVNIPQQQLQYGHMACHHYGLQSDVESTNEEHSFK